MRKNSDKIKLTVKQLKRLMESNFDGPVSIEEIKEKLNSKIDEVFYECQNKMGIRYGDLSPDETFELDEKIENLAGFIFDTLKIQQQENSL